jgi:hypothetical protein
LLKGAHFPENKMEVESNNVAIRKPSLHFTGRNGRRKLYGGAPRQETVFAGGNHSGKMTLNDSSKVPQLEGAV